jgi:hypothetical protein
MLMTKIDKDTIHATTPKCILFVARNKEKFEARA